MGSVNQVYTKILNHFGISQKRNFICVLAVFTLFSCIFTFVPTFLNLEIHHLHLFSQDLMSLDFAMPYVGCFFGTLVFPFLVRKFSIKRILIVSFFLLGVEYALIIVLLKSDYNIVLRFFFGLIYITIFLVLFMYQGKIFTSSYQSRLFLFAGLLSGVAYAFGSFLNDVISQNFSVWGTAFFLIISCLLISFKIEDDKEEKKPEDSHLKKDSSGEKSYRELIKESPWVFLIVFMGYVTFYGFSTYYPLFGEKLGLTEGKAASFLATAQFCGLFLMPVGGYLGDKFGYEKSTSFIIIVSLGMIGASFFTQNETLISVFFSVAEGGMLSFYTLTTAWVVSLYSHHNLAKSLSLLNFIGQGGAMLSPFGMGALLRFYGSDGFISWFFIGMSLVLMLLLGRRFFRKKTDS